MSDFETELEAQVQQLLTRLMAEVAKLLQLEEHVVQLKKENTTLKANLAQKPIEAQATHDARVLELSAEMALISAARETAEERAKTLEAEVEELTASLFSEAGNMVSSANKMAEKYKIKNGKLQEELEERNTIISDLQAQLTDLKLLFFKIEEQQRSHASTPQRHEDPFLLAIVHSPRVRAVRYDVGHYADFKTFVCLLLRADFTFDLAGLRNLKYFRRIWAEEVEPTVPHVPSVSGANFMHRLTKGKTFWLLLAEGKAIIEPIAGVNETFKLTYKGAKQGVPPMAAKDPCSFCGEAKDDMLEHARLYYLKLYSPAEGGAVVLQGEPHTEIATFPLCNFCLLKLRAICEFFAKLRLIHSNIHKIQPPEVEPVFFRPEVRVQTLPEDEPVFVKLYMMLLTVRARIFWSKIGFWDTAEDAETAHPEEEPLDVFERIVRENVAFGGRPSTEEPTHGQGQGGKKDETEESREESTENLGESGKESTAGAGVTNTETEAALSAATESARNMVAEPGGAEFVEPGGAETVESGDGAEGGFGGAAPDAVHESPVGLTRRKSSKQFKEQLDRDLDTTLDMLKETIEGSPAHSRL